MKITIKKVKEEFVMKTSNAVKLSLVIVIVAFTSTITGYIFGARANSKMRENSTRNETAMEIAAKEEKVLKEEPKTIAVTQSYLLKDSNGYISLYHKYSDGKETLYKNYDISVKTLPQSDREALKKGIEVGSLSEALQLIEDYS